MGEVGTAEGGVCGFGKQSNSMTEDLWEGMETEGG